jgi:hypothetical protein
LGRTDIQETRTELSRDSCGALQQSAEEETDLDPDGLGSKLNILERQKAKLQKKLRRLKQE